MIKIKMKKGYINNAEDVIGHRNPAYDEDNIAFETTRYHEEIPTHDILKSSQCSSKEMGRLENASRQMIQEGLKRIK